MNIQENVPLAPHTTLRIGGPARYYATALSEEELRDAALWARSRSLPVFVLGGGSNLVISDDGFPGLVLHVRLRGIEATQDGRVVAAAGEDWDALVSRCVAAGLAGIECLSGIPGSVGGTPVQNVGAYGQEVSATIRSVRAMDIATGEFRNLAASECGFSYRTSIFNSSERGRHVVSSVTYELDPGGAPRLDYKELKDRFEGRPAPSLAEVREAVLTVRAGKSMLLASDDPNSRSAGSFFKNPIVREPLWAALEKTTGVPAPRYAVSPGLVKVPAAWLIDRAGFQRGERRGPVGISSRHTLALVNFGGNATAAQLMKLAVEIQARVMKRFGIELEMEPVRVGFGE